MNTYRVFVTRHYIAVEFFDIAADTEKKALSLAEKAAYKVRPDARASACDNGWIAREADSIKELGLSSAGINPLRKVLETKYGTAYQFDDAEVVS